MADAVNKSRPTGILERVTCPHCWEQFAPEKTLWISEHSDLLGDNRLPDQSQRFLPTRFTVKGEAIDSKGFPCHQLACPNCHLVVPRPLFEMEPLFLSIFGAPASGKSYFLAAMTDPSRGGGSNQAVCRDSTIPSCFLKSKVREL